MIWGHFPEVGGPVESCVTNRAQISNDTELYLPQLTPDYPTLLTPLPGCLLWEENSGLLSTCTLCSEVKVRGKVEFFC